MRKVIVVNPQTNSPVTIETDVTNWSELKELISRKGIDVSGMKGVVRETKVSLESAEANLPEGDFTVFLFTAKVKSGNPVSLKSVLESLQEELNNAFTAIIEEIEDGDHDLEDSESCSGCSEEYSELKKELEG